MLFINDLHSFQEGRGGYLNEIKDLQKIKVNRLIFLQYYPTKGLSIDYGVGLARLFALGNRVGTSICLLIFG